MNSDYIVYPVFREIYYPHACRILGSADQPKMHHWVGLKMGKPAADHSEGHATAIDYVLGQLPWAVGVVLVPKLALHDAPSEGASDWMLREYPMFARDNG